MKIVDPYPSERLIEAANLIHYLPGIKVKTRVKKGARCLVLEVSGIQNNDFEATISRTLSRDPPYKKEELVRIFEVIRLIDPILSEFKNSTLEKIHKNTSLISAVSSTGQVMKLERTR
jgi:hypothetical protein